MRQGVWGVWAGCTLDMRCRKDGIAKTKLCSVTFATILSLLDQLLATHV